MKKSGKVIYISILLGIFSFCSGNPLFGQEKVNISAGIGLPELINVGVRYQIDQMQIGISFGSVPVKDESLISVSGDIFYHFAGLSEFSNRRPWYGRVGLVYLRDETNTFIKKYLFLNSRVGRDFNVSEKIGVQIDAGVIFQLYNDQVKKEPSNGWDFDLNFPVFPSFGAGIYYRF